MIQDAETFERFEEIDVPADRCADFEVRTKTLRFSCRLNPKPGSNRLYVSIKSYIERPHEEPPAYDRWNWDMDSHILAVCDPTFHLDKSVRSAFFIGRQTDDAVSGLLQLACRVAKVLNISRDRIVYWGASSGAFGAAMAAIRSHQGRAVLVNPLLELADFRDRFQSTALVQTFQGGTLDEMFENYPLRMSVSAALRKAWDEHREPKLLLVQNLVDRLFHTRQFVPFCNSFGLPLECGFDRSGTLRSMTYSDSAGHGIESYRVLQEILATRFPLTDPVSLPREDDAP